MATFSMTCSSGHSETFEAESREAAVAMVKAGMTEQAIAEHMRDYHEAGEPAPTVAQAHAMIEQQVTAVA